MGLTRIPAQPFRLEDQGIWNAKQRVVDAWGLPTVALDELNLNRKGTIIAKPGRHAAFSGREAVLDRFDVGFKWQPDDARSGQWIPQGLTDSGAGGNGRARWLVVSWHHEGKPDKGMRVTFADIGTWRDPIRYRHVLLVNPVDADEVPSKHVSFAAIGAHAGGALWFRNYLYMADSRGFDRGRPGGVLVFDLTRIKEVDPSRDDAIGWSARDGKYYGYGYRYVLPQVGRYVQQANGGTRVLRWSFVGLDRTNGRPSMMMGEYTTSATPRARLIWWPLDPASGRLKAGPDGAVAASLARACTSERYLQGCSSENALDGGTVWLSRTSKRDALHQLPVEGGKGKTYAPWAEQPEGLSYVPAGDRLWCVTERARARAVFAVKRSEL
ncbi:MAG TPA: hypothetical protein VIL35_04360 [Vicinamibacterales bacterium]